MKRSQEAVICRAMSMHNCRRGCADASTANTAFYVVKYSVFSTDKEEARAFYVCVIYAAQRFFKVSVTHTGMQ